MIIVIALTGCNKKDFIEEEVVEVIEVIEVVEEVVEVVDEPDNVYIVAGQSNASGCDWSYFEGITGSEVVNISIPGYDIQWLKSLYEPESVKGLKPKGIIFVHGETDAIRKTDGDVYIERVENYRLMISGDVGRDLPLLISTVGYYDQSPDVDFDNIRNAVIDEADINPLWNISYNSAKNFRDWGMIKPDGIHFNTTGCQVMMEAIAASL